MSCITKILSKTGNKPFCVPSRRAGKSRTVGLVIEGGGEYKGYEYLVTFTDLGHRCGYVAIPHDHPIDKLEAEGTHDIGIECHGGVTFFEREHRAKSFFGIACNDAWVGFDCAHGFDGKDFEMLEKYYGKDCQQMKFYDEYPHFKMNHTTEPVRDFNYVERQCKKIIDQLIEMEKAA